MALITIREILSYAFVWLAGVISGLFIAWFYVEYKYRRDRSR